MLRIKKFGAGLLCLIFTASSMGVTVGLLGIDGAAVLGEVYSGGWNEKNDRRINDPNLIWGIPKEWVGIGKGQTRLLYKDYKLVHDTSYVPRQQGKAPSCVGQAVAAAIDILAAAQIRSGHSERGPPAPAAACVIYGLSRNEIGGGNLKFGGSHNLWACQAIHQYGVVARLDYPLLGIDLRRPSSSRAIAYGAKGVPDALEIIAGLHTVKEYISIDSYTELRDAIYMGCPVVVGSSQGFGDKRRKRDGDGFLNPPWRLLRKSVWNHSMVIIGVCDTGRRGALVLNSWGSNWIRGPKRLGDEPDGSFWVDWDIIERMVQQGDSFAIREFSGYPNYQLWGQ